MTWTNAFMEFIKKRALVVFEELVEPVETEKREEGS